MRVAFVIATLLWPFFAASAPTNGMNVYDVNPWFNNGNGIRFQPDMVPATEGWPADHTIDIDEVPGRIENAAVALRIASAVTDLQLTPTDLVGPSGRIPVANIDIRVAKMWWQGNRGWTDIGNEICADDFDTGGPPQTSGSPDGLCDTDGVTTLENDRYDEALLIPELLLKNDALIQADAASPFENRALVGGGPSTVTLNTKASNSGRLEQSGATYNFNDASTLQAFDMASNVSEWVWVAVTVPSDAGAGLYTGTIDMDDGTTNYGTIEINLTVRDFSLPEVGRAGAYYRGVHSSGSDLVGSETKDTDQLQAEFAEMRRAGISPIVYQPLASLGALMDEMVTAGWTSGPFYYLGVRADLYSNDASGNTAFGNDVKTARDLAILKGFDGSDFWIYGKDEAASGHTAELGNYAAAQAEGAKLFVADDEELNGIDALLGTPPEIDMLIDAKHPLEASEAIWHTDGREIVAYANRQTQVEDSYSVRRNYGMVVWAQGYDGFMTYAWQDAEGHIYNDQDATSTLRDSMLCAPTRNGCIRTIALEGYREAIDDFHLIKELERRIALYNNGADTALDAAADAAQTYLNTLEASVEDGDDDPARITESPANLDIDLIAMRQTLMDHIERLNPKNTQEYR